MSKPRTSPRDEPPSCILHANQVENTERNNNIRQGEARDPLQPSRQQQASPWGLTCTSWGAEQDGGDVCSHLLPFICTDFYRLSVVCLHSQQFLGRADALSAVSPVPGGDEREQVLQSSSQPRHCPTFRNSKRCTCVTASHKAVGSWRPETWRGPVGPRHSHDLQTTLPPDLSHHTDRERLDKGWTQLRVSGQDCKPKLQIIPGDTRRAVFT